MSADPQEVMHLLDGACRSRCAFALMRRPNEDDFTLVAQHAPDAEVLPGVAALAGRRGFAAVPFEASADCPPVLIHADTTACGWDGMADALAAFAAREPALQAQPDAALRSAGKADYMAAFGKAMDALQSRTLHKVVLSRAEMESAPGISPAETFWRACEAYPQMMVCLFHSPQTGTWLSATPELLLSGGAQGWRTAALAGTMPVQEGRFLADWDAKNRGEQSHVVEFMRDTLAQFSNDVQEDGPRVSPAGHLAHLRTDFRFTLPAGTDPAALLAALHPTPAVCGRPSDAARALIARMEPAPRRYYSGFFGMLDAAAHSELYVNLRCMEMFADSVVLHAGGGLVRDSSAESEWQETQEKMNTLRRLIS